MKRISLILATLLLSGWGTNALAELRIGVVDLQKIMQTSEEVKILREKLEKEFKPRQNKLVAMEASVKKDIDNGTRDAAVMGAKEKDELKKKIEANRESLAKEGEEYQKALMEAQNAGMESLYSKMHAAIASVAESEKFTIILQKDATPYSEASLDITEKVLAQMDKKA